MSFTVNANIPSKTSSALGSFSRIITSGDRSVFGIAGTALEDAVGRTRGRRPNQAWTNSPAVAGGTELYSTYGWSEVRTQLRPIRSSIDVPQPSQTIVAQATLRNNSSVAGEFFANLSNTSTNTATTSWSNTHGISVSQSVSYGIDLIGGETSFGYSYNWGTGGEQSQASSVSFVTGVTVTLQPGQAVVVDLVAEVGTARVTAVYDTTLSGSVAQNYNPPFENHHFWSHGINTILNGGGLSTSRQTTATVDVGYFARGEVIMRDLHGATLSVPHKIQKHSHEAAAAHSKFDPKQVQHADPAPGREHL